MRADFLVAGDGDGKEKDEERTAFLSDAVFLKNKWEGRENYIVHIMH